VCAALCGLIDTYPPVPILLPSRCLAAGRTSTPSLARTPQSELLDAMRAALEFSCLWVRNRGALDCGVGSVRGLDSRSVFAPQSGSIRVAAHSRFLMTFWHAPCYTSGTPPPDTHRVSHTPCYTSGLPLHIGHTPSRTVFFGLHGWCVGFLVLTGRVCMVVFGFIEETFRHNLGPGGAIETCYC